jgi:hypothetical protein
MYLKYHQKLGHWSLLSYHNGGRHVMDIIQDQLSVPLKKINLPSL